MPLREVQVNRGLFQIAMSKQHLDSAQVGPGFQQMRGKAMTQCVRMDVPVLKACAFGRLLTGSPEHLGGDRMTRCMPSVAGKQPVRALASESTPLHAQRIQQSRTQHHIAVLASLAPRM
jgi:hypothetical protein